MQRTTRTAPAAGELHVLPLLPAEHNLHTRSRSAAAGVRSSRSSSRLAGPVPAMIAVSCAAAPGAVLSPCNVRPPAARCLCSVLLDSQVQAAHPRLRQMATALQSKGLRVRSFAFVRAVPLCPASCAELSMRTGLFVGRQRSASRSRPHSSAHSTCHRALARVSWPCSTTS